MNKLIQKCLQRPKVHFYLLKCVPLRWHDGAVTNVSHSPHLEKKYNSRQEIAQEYEVAKPTKPGFEDDILHFWYCDFLIFMYLS